MVIYMEKISVENRMKRMIFPAQYVIIKEKECRLQEPGGLQAAHTEEEPL